MAIYHFSAKIGSRASGQSAVASASYRSASKLYSHDAEKYFDYTRKNAVVYSKIFLPANAPKDYADRQTLWNAVEKIEKQKNSQLYREFEISLPNECTKEQKIEMVEKFCRILQNEGMCVDVSIHDVKAGQRGKKGKEKKNDNSHAHIMAPLRAIGENGEFLPKRIRKYKLNENGEKIPIIDPKTGKQKIEKKTGRKLWEREDINTTNWGDKEKLQEWREVWQNIANEYLPEGEKIDRRTLTEQIKDWETALEEFETKLQVIKEREKDNERIREQIANAERELAEREQAISRRKRETIARINRPIPRNDTNAGVFGKIGGQSTSDRAIITKDNGSTRRDFVGESIEHQIDERERRVSAIKREREEVERRERERQERDRKAREAEQRKRKAERARQARNNKAKSSKQEFSR